MTTALLPDLSFETAALSRGFLRIAGVDEAGRGPLAGPVVAAAVILDPDNLPAGLNDSKKLSAKRRDALAEEIRAKALWGIGLADVAEIDSLNILRASHVAMCRALAALPNPADLALIDGNLLPRDLEISGEAIVKGDARSLSIAAASILAKTHRDAIMIALDREFPGYGWARNAGYPSPAHKSALETLGVTPHHRLSFEPVRRCCVKNPE